jgi:H+/Cl- antiporter ClcA
VRRLFVAIVLAVCVGAPLIEMFDRWDTVQDGNDTESNLVIVVLCVGAGLASAAALVRRVRPTLTGSRIVPTMRACAHAMERWLIPPAANTSPPDLLRV